MNTKWGKRAWPAAWTWMDFIKPITKGKEQKRDLPVAYIYSDFQKNHLKRLSRRTPSSEHELLNFLCFFAVTLSDQINIPRFVYLLHLYHLV